MKMKKATSHRGINKLLGASAGALGLMIATNAYAGDGPSSHNVAGNVHKLEKVGTNKVIIHGAFTLAKSSNPGSWGPVETGYLFYECKPTEEKMCEMQWDDIAKTAGKQICVGFGQSGANPGTVRVQGSNPMNPDGYPLGFGVSPMFYASTCQSVLAVMPMGGTTTSSSGAGGAGGGGSTTSGVGGMAATTTSATSGTTTTGAGATTTSGGSTNKAAPGDPNAEKKSGCSISSGSNDVLASLPLLALLVARLRRRRAR
jgi:uncharacterized protein (TIGR03382 family)